MPYKVLQTYKVKNCFQHRALDILKVVTEIREPNPVPRAFVTYVHLGADQKDRCLWA